MGAGSGAAAAAAAGSPPMSLGAMLLQALTGGGVGPGGALAGLRGLGALGGAGSSGLGGPGLGDEDSAEDGRGSAFSRLFSRPGGLTGLTGGAAAAAGAGSGGGGIGGGGGGGDSSSDALGSLRSRLSGPPGGALLIRTGGPGEAGSWFLGLAAPGGGIVPVRIGGPGAALGDWDLDMSYERWAKAAPALLKACAFGVG